jgi:chromosomal replication initiation ATPase DnaA
MTGKPEQLPFELGHRAAFAREDFFVSACNAQAIAWLDKFPAWPAPLLLIHGPAASGKTHLLHVWRQETDAGIYDAAHVDGAPAAVIVDDMETMIGDLAAEESLLHLYNLQKERGGHILAAASTPPAQWAFQLRDLESRLKAAPAVAIGAPDDTLMAIVLTKLFSDRQIFVPQEVVSFMVPRLTRTFAAMRDMVDTIDRKAMVEKRAVTIPLIRDLIQGGQE